MAAPNRTASSAADINLPSIRTAGRDVLSLALMEARNRTLGLATSLDSALQLRCNVADGNARGGQAVAAKAVAARALRDRHELAFRIGNAAWFSEFWVSRNPQVTLGTRAQPVASSHLASIDPNADRFWGHRAPPALVLPSLDDTRAYLMAAFEACLEQLSGADETDDALYFYRLSLAREDALYERLLMRANRWGVPVGVDSAEAMTLRPAIGLCGVNAQIGWAGPGFCADNERSAHDVSLVAYSIDAQAVSWAQFVEFVDDGGYDQLAWWSPEGWAWLLGLPQGRRGPRGVEQIGVASGAVMQHSFGRLTRRLANQPVMHVTWFEAEAWCNWAGRRLPTEAEWENAAKAAARQGFRWGDVVEWTASHYAPYPGFTACPSSLGAGTASVPGAKVLRGASFATPSRQRHVTRRASAPPTRDHAFVGFRSIALF